MPLTDNEIRKYRLALAPFDPERLEQLSKIEREAFARFTGLFDELEAAIGMLRIGDHLGWKPLVLIHNKRTIRKYEEILGIEIREFFKEEGPSAHRSRGYTIAKTLGNFWKAVSGAIKDDELKAKRRSLV
jgi:hypothetical protein